MLFASFFLGFLHYISINHASRRFSRYTVFVHGDERAWHTPGDLSSRIINWNYGFYPFMSLNFEAFRCFKTMIPEKNNIAAEEWLRDLMHPIVGFGPFPIGYTLCNHASAQFVVNRERMLAQPAELFSKGFQWFKGKTREKGMRPNP